MAAPLPFDPSQLPAHVGIIMDGNGRWARLRNQARTQGHLEGLKAAKRVVKAASDAGLRFVTLYAFSTENWKRTAEEVGFLMGLIKKHLAAEFDFYRENRIRVRHTGALTSLPPEIVQEIRSVCDDTRSFDGLTVVLALNYGGRDEIVRAVHRLIAENNDPLGITEQSIAAHLDNPDIPDPDLIIRTASEKRISNFLLWEGAYAEFYFSDKLWPDWSEGDLFAALQDYQSRDRRFGGIRA